MTDTLRQLEAVIRARSGGDPATSYVARLFTGGMPLIARKVGEEAIETVIAALSADRSALTSEAADLLFHLIVMLSASDVRLADLEAELERREGVSGLDEKAARTR